MSVWFGRGGLLIAIGAMALSAGCDIRMCHPGIDAQGRYRLDVLGVYDEQSAFTFKPQYASSRGPAAATRCAAGGDGLMSGATLRLQATGSVANNQDTCSVVSSKVVAGPSQISWQGPSSDRYTVNEVRSADPVLFAAENVTIGACSGTVGFSLLAVHSPEGLFAEPTAGRVPPTVLYRMFLTDTPGCVPCDNNFVVRLAKE